MSKKCDICGKGPRFGNNVSHSHKKTRTKWDPNVKPMKVLVNGQVKKVKVCMSCLRSGRVQRPVAKLLESK